MSDTASPQLTLSLSESVGPGFDDFVAGPNASVVAAVREASRRHSPVWPLLWGPAECGKTHLLLAASGAAPEAGRRGIFLSAEQLIPMGVEGLELAEGNDLVCLDDLDRLLGHPDWEEALFHAFNRWRRDGCSVILSASQAPASLPVGLPDLRSRLNWGSTHAIFPLDDLSRRELLKRRGRRHGIDVGDEVLDYLMSRSRRAIGRLVACVDRMAELSFSEKRKITVPLARTVLEQLNRIEDGGSE